MKSGLCTLAATAGVLCWVLAALPADAQEDEQDERTTLNVLALIEPLGISTLSLLSATALAGLFMKKNRRVLLRVHKTLAILTVISAICHASLVLLF